MTLPNSIIYIEAKSRVVRHINRTTNFVKASIEFNNDRSSVGKRAKYAAMVLELKTIRQAVEADIQNMETSVNEKTAPIDVVDHSSSNSLIETFDSMYYELVAFADIHSLPLKVPEECHSVTAPNQTTGLNNTIPSFFHLPKRKFPTFSGNVTEYQGFEDLFQSILSHAPELPDVERFEYLKSSLEGEALTLISHLPLTAANYKSAWEILRARYGNKRDLSRIHIEALLTPHVVKFNDSSSIKTLINTILKHTAALDNLEFLTRQWSPLLLHLFEKNLDYELRSRWELEVGERHIPYLSEFVNFLRTHIRSAEVNSNYSTSSKPTQKIKSRFSSTKVLSTTTTQPSITTSVTACPMCNGTHSIRKCSLFIDKTPNDRFQIAKTYHLCINCLGSGHTSTSCLSKKKCQTCNKSHHTLLHFDLLKLPSTSSSNAQTVDTPSTTSLIVKGQTPQVVLLSTVLLETVSSDGRRHSLRALVDSGSQASFITERCASALMLQRRYAPVNVSSFANTASTSIRGKTTVTITPYGQKTPSIIVNTLIVPQITGLTPQIPVASGNWDHIQSLPLADPSYATPGTIDLLLGADIVPSILLSGQRTGKEGEPIALETVFGWIPLGPTSSTCQTTLNSLCVSVDETLDAILKQFWELEELPTVQHLSPDDITAEQIYRTTTTRLQSGRFMVTLPFRKPRPSLGDSKTLALQRYKSLEVRLSRNKNLHQQYQEFMQDYLKSGHMELIPLSERNNPINYYVPHHCVLKPDSSTTKLRVVFNASARTSTGYSLNDSLYTGPKLQPDIQVILLRARLWKYVFMTDIKQMYRQILIHPSDRDYLRIFWRFSPNDPINEYRLYTLTYGTLAAPFQALRTIRELATVDGSTWPLAAGVLLNDTFIDDILTGANTEIEALECQSQLSHLCSQAQFELRKWASNNMKILQAVPHDAQAMSPSVLLDNSENPELKVLGLKWNPLIDIFSFKTQVSTNLPTKRSVLSDIARVFDPLGLLSPITFWTKHFMQRLWSSGVDWDDQIPDELLGSWKHYQSELRQIENISIPRRLTHDDAICTQLHAFSDSSEKGYAAAIYLRIQTKDSIFCQLVSGKSKVAPLKRTTIPRLELCGAVLAAKLLRFVATSFQGRIYINKQYAWTDSTTTLIWICSSPHRWATFVANRTSQIQELTSPSIWRYVPTQSNPVDCATRGLFPSEIVNHPLWWTGPSFLFEPIEQWPKLPDNSHNDTETGTEIKRTTVLHININSGIMNLLYLHSSLNKILRIVAYCLRWSSRSSTKKFTTIHADEIPVALSSLIYYIQSIVYSSEISCLTKGLQCSKNIRRLNPFLDENGLVRVGGRLRHADIPYDHKHHILLPSNHRLTDLLIDHHHNTLKHPGSSTLQAHLQRTYWIQSARRVIRSRLCRCIACFRTRPRNIEPKMAPLPRYRVQQIKLFAVSGVDYAGPITMKGIRGRHSASTSAYICLFVCTATKAIHLELSSNLSTESFLLAFTRFSSRRGPIKEMHSDCGTNFVGAANLLTPLHNLTRSDTFQTRVKTQLSNQQISWYFNPPSSPHFGGLWEAGVKSTKSLTLRSIGLHRLTNEELTTLLCQIEATLNSRPLCSLSNDPDDLEALTPSHFLTLEPSTSLPDPHLDTVPLSKLQRWRLLSDIHRHFWTRWKNKYLSRLQLRTKWSKEGKSLCVRDLVLIKEAVHPLHWRLGRVQTLHPGSDGITRVATINTATGKLMRPLVKLCPLPISCRVPSKWAVMFTPFNINIFCMFSPLF